MKNRVDNANKKGDGWSHHLCAAKKNFRKYESLLISGIFPYFHPFKEVFFVYCHFDTFILSILHFIISWHLRSHSFFHSPRSRTPTAGFLWGDGTWASWRVRLAWTRLDTSRPSWSLCWPCRRKPAHNTNRFKTNVSVSCFRSYCTIIVTVLHFFLILCQYFCLYIVSFPPSWYLVASHAVAVEYADFLVLLTGHVVQTLVGLHVTDLSRIHTHTDTTWRNSITWTLNRTLWFKQDSDTLCLDFSLKAVTHRCVSLSHSEER